MKRAGQILAAAAVAILVAGCTAAPDRVSCVRRELGSMGSDNQFHLKVTDDATLGERDRIELAFTIVPPIAGPVVLVRRGDDGREISRLQLKLVAVAGMTTRCTVAATAKESTCEATLASLPANVVGNWTVEAKGNALLEAGMTLRICD